jgi:flagellar M-ring protein FliF
MNALTQLLSRLSNRQKIVITVVFLAVVGGVFAFSRSQKQKDFKPLFTELAAEEAGQIAERLKTGNVEFQIGEDGKSILVPSARVAELRVELAAAGLPRTGRIGFELFDKVNFGLTEFAEQVNYHRALEGELERTITTIGEIESARVHLTFAKESIFEEERRPARASVVLKLKMGEQMKPASVKAIQWMLANAVEGLQPELVSIVDASGTLLNRPRKSLTGEMAELDPENLEYQRQMERSILARVNNTLEPLLGADHFRVSVAAECDISSIEQSEETFDPNKTAVTQQQKSEEQTGQQDSSGAAGTPSNLPRPVGRFAAGAMPQSRKTENASYQTSRVVKHVKTPKGALRRLSVSVLLDQKVRWEGQGPGAKRIVEPPTPEALQSIKDVVIAAAGIVDTRGDKITVESLPFEATLQQTPPAVPGPVKADPKAKEDPAAFSLPVPNWVPAPINQPTIFYSVVGVAGLLLLLGLGFGVKMLLGKFGKGSKAVARRGGRRVMVQSGQDELPGSEESAGGSHALEGGTMTSSEMSIPSGPNVANEFREHVAAQNQMKRQMKEEALAALKGGSESGARKSEVLVQHLGEESKRDPVAIAQIVRTWLEEA